MHRFGPDHYLNSSAGILAQIRRRHMRRIHFEIHDVEPCSKDAMPPSDKIKIQQQVLRQLEGSRRLAFRGPLALQLRLNTTAEKPSHLHHIAKNLLDLFGKPSEDLNTRKRSLIYCDDKQIVALGVNCSHGQAKPWISISAASFNHLREDLALIENSSDLCSEDDDDDGFSFKPNAIDRLAELLKDEDELRKDFGSRHFETMLLMARQTVQEYLLGQRLLKPTDLAKMYNVLGDGLGSDSLWEELISSSPFRISLSEPPQQDGGSKLLKREIEEKLHAFKARYERLITPLAVPVALEVVIKPPPTIRQRGLHDLDNVVRSYLIPNVVSILNPVSHYTFAFDRLPHEDGDADTKQPPRSTRAGVTRYEVWRLPPAMEGFNGFINVAIVTDWVGQGGIFGKIDAQISKFEDSL